MSSCIQMRGTLSISWIVRDTASTFRMASRSSGQGSVVLLHMCIPVNGWSSVPTILVCDFLWFVFISVTLGFWCCHRGVMCTVPVWIYISHRCWLGLGATTDIHDQQRRKPKIPPILENISPQTTSKMSLDSYKACKRSQLMHPNVRNGTRSGIWTRGSTQLNPPPTMHCLLCMTP